jgi:hypothetical protein
VHSEAAKRSITLSNARSLTSLISSSLTSGVRVVVACQELPQALLLGKCFWWIYTWGSSPSGSRTSGSSLPTRSGFWLFFCSCGTHCCVKENTTDYKSSTDSFWWYGDEDWVDFKPNGSFTKTMSHLTIYDTLLILLGLLAPGFHWSRLPLSLSHWILHTVSTIRYRPLARHHHPPS